VDQGASIGRPLTELTARVGIDEPIASAFAGIFRRTWGFVVQSRRGPRRKTSTNAIEETMFKKRVNTVTTAIVAVIIPAIFSLGFAAAAADAAEIFTLKSTTFADGKMMPKKVANSAANAPNNANCVGENVSPQLSWSSVPDGTKSLVLLMTDPEGRGGSGSVHWVAYGIPASVSGFAEGEVSKPSDKYVGGKNTQGVGYYLGPCTPGNQMAHHYAFILIATDFAPSELALGLTREEVAAKLVPAGQPPAHTKGVAGMVGLFVNPWHE
jgi:Raf kinase inhibitor-like YbhB/YbcL family protein